MTKDFTEVVGRGSFGCVYKGTYEHTAVALKSLILWVRLVFVM